MRRKKAKSSEAALIIQLKRDETQYRCLDCDFTATSDNFNYADNETVCSCCGSSRVVKVSTIEHLYHK